MKHNFSFWKSKYEKLVVGKLTDGIFSYGVIPTDFNPADFIDCSVIFVDHLNPGFFIFFSHIKCIVTRRGSSLSHLSILAREYGITVIRVNFPKTIPHLGNVAINTKENFLSL